MSISWLLPPHNKACALYDLPSGGLVGDQCALQPRDQVLDLQLAALHALDLEFVVGDVVLEALDLGVEQPVFLAQQGKALGHACEFPGIGGLVHGCQLSRKR